jgi:enterochelin esterase-like enzyme
MQDAIETTEKKERTLRVVTPDSYGSMPARRFPLLLVLNAGGEETLDAGRHVARLHAEGILPEMIVASLSGDVPLADLSAVLRDLEEKFRLLESPRAHWICGTGHDAIIALRAALDHPDLLGAAACLSSSFEGAEGAPPLHSPMLRELEDRSFLPGSTRLYFDYGTVGLDECYEPYHRDLGAIFRSKGWEDDREFRIARITGGTHDPSSWRDRLGPALQWLALR